VSDDALRHRFYGELASWWPIISRPDDYAEEAAYIAGLLRAAPRPVRTVLELGSGGGSNAVHLKHEFALTLVDLSDEMLDVSRALNPECAHAPGDMRSVRLDRTFDAVFLHDAVDYMLTEDDLGRAFATAFAHCAPGGIVVVVPDSTRENFEPGTDHGGHDGADGRAVRFLEWTWDPDPTDSEVATEYAFLLRDRNGVRVVHETHRLGVFDRATWLRLLAAAGFDARHEVEVTTEDRAPRDVFLGVRPAT
jgi:SAM-dependent methyltransferase